MCSRRQSLTVLLLACSETSPSPQFQCLSQYGAHVTGRFYVNIEVGGGRGLEVLKRMVQTMLNLYRRTSPFSGSRAKRKAWDTSVFPHCYNPAFSACLRLVVLMSDLAAAVSSKRTMHAQGSGLGPPGHAVLGWFLVLLCVSPQKFRALLSRFSGPFWGRRFAPENEARNRVFPKNFQFGGPSFGTQFWSHFLALKWGDRSLNAARILRTRLV